MAVSLKVIEEDAVGRESCTDVLEDVSIAGAVVEAEVRALFPGCHKLTGAEWVVARIH
jgi:hypothetical protein